MDFPIEVNNPSKHHSALPILFFTEMWERFSYYGMRALLVLYLVKQLNFTDYRAGIVYGTYTGLVYLTPILGGYISDRYIGKKVAILLGGVLMMLGHLTLALDSLNTFYLGLLFLILWNGFFKPNISTLLGNLYDSKEGLRDSAFTIFYMGINIGGSLGPLFCGYIGEVYGWHYGFSLAGIGMFLGLLVFSFGVKKIDSSFFIINKFSNNKDKSEKEKLSKLERNKVFLLFFLAIMSIFFWVPYEQMGTSVNLFTDRNVDRTLFGFEIPTSTFQSINGFLILILAPIFALIWQKLSQKKLEPSVPLKFAIGFILLGFSYLILLINNGDSKTSITLLIGYYFLLTMGELCVSPVGLSTVSRLAPSRFASSLMGVWFMSNAISHYISGWFSGAYSSWMSIQELFLFLGVISLISALLLISILPILKKYFPENQKD